MIAAYDRRRAIGKNGRIPWRIPGEQQRFRSLTLGQTVIFGRRTYEEIGVPLPGRENFIVSRTRQFTGAHLRTFPTLADAVAAAETEQVFLGGGAGIYAEGMALAETLKALPVLNRRIRLAVGLQYVILSVAAGKAFGAAIYFLRGFG